MALVKAWVILEVAITHLGRHIRALRLTNASYRMSHAPTPPGETWAERALAAALLALSRPTNPY